MFTRVASNAKYQRIVIISQMLAGIIVKIECRPSINISMSVIYAKIYSVIKSINNVLLCTIPSKCRFPKVVRQSVSVLAYPRIVIIIWIPQHRVLALIRGIYSLNIFIVS